MPVQAMKIKCNIEIEILNKTQSKMKLEVKSSVLTNFTSGQGDELSGNKDR